MDEKQRINQVLSGNVSEFNYFVETYQNMALTIAFRICNNMQDAEDIVQDSFVKAYRNLYLFRNKSKFSTWLYRIVYNNAITHTRTKIWISDEDIEESDASYEASDFDSEKMFDASNLTDLVQHVLGEMPVGDALILTLYYLEENPVKEIVKITGLSESNVKVKLFRARNLFKKIVKTRYGITNFTK